MTRNLYHDVVNDDVLGIAFLASNSIIDYSFLWWHKYAIVSEVSYWWKEFDRCVLDRYMLFTDQEQCYKFRKVSVNYDIEADSCIVVPPSLYDTFAASQHVRIVHSVDDDAETLSIMSAHHSRPEST
jgi:hypothetical protein